jgi:hypothetical protein
MTAHALGHMTDLPKVTRVAGERADR